MHANVVIAIGPDESIPAILSHIHQAGLGHNAFLVRPRRTSIQHQLQRSGIPTAQMPDRVDGADAALVIHAAARSQMAADIARQYGASATWIVSRVGSWDLVDDDVVMPAQMSTQPAESPAALTTPGRAPVLDPIAPDESVET